MCFYIVAKTGPNAKTISCSWPALQFCSCIQENTMNQFTHYEIKSDFDTNLYDSICNAKTLLDVFSTEHHLQAVIVNSEPLGTMATDKFTYLHLK